MRRCVLAALAVVAPFAAAGTVASASSVSRAIVVGRGIAGVQLGQTKAQVRSRLGAPPCGCDSDFWLYAGAGSGSPPVAGVGFATNGGVAEVFAYGGRATNDLRTARGVGLGSTLAAVAHAYTDARCAILPVARRGGPRDGRCAIVSRTGQSDADTVFIAQAGGDTVAGAIDEVAVDLLGTAAADTIKVSVAPRSIHARRTATAKLTVAVTSEAFYDFPNGVGIAGEHLRLSTTDRGERIGRVTDHGNGTYTATITASTVVGTATITASDGAAAGRGQLRQSSR